jgi:magnesium chelatase subunit D
MIDYPFTALVGQSEMKLALVLNAINPRLGGVLIRGQKGTAKSTAARGLAALLPPIDVVAGCRFACDPQPGAARCPDCLGREDLPVVQRAPSFVDLPIGATEDRVLGTLDLERAIQTGQRSFEPGLLARANRGLLYVDEVNLLPDHLVDALLDAAAMGTNTVEREGVSFSHPAAFVLVGTMNPEEGDLRPQLLDRFALAVDVAGMPEPTERAEVVRRRVAYEADPHAFAECWRAEEDAERARIAAARACLPGVRLADHLLDLIARICVEFDVDGLRADVVMYKTALTLAAYNARREVDIQDVQRAAELALPHRRRRQPFDQPGLDHERLEQLISEHEHDDEPPSGEHEHDDEPPPGEPAVPPDLPEQPPSAHQQPSSEPQVYEIGPAESLDLPPQRRAATRTSQSARRGRAHTESPAGRHIGSRPWRSHGALDVLATLQAAAPYQYQRAATTPLRLDHADPPYPQPSATTSQLDVDPPCQQPRPATIQLRLQQADLRRKVRKSPDRWCTLFVVDASGSMAARRRMAAAKAAVLSLLQHAYQRRDLVGLIGFRGTQASLLLPPTNSADLAYARLRDLPTGGRTPLASALWLAHSLLARQATSSHGLAVLVSDGRGNVSVSGGDPQIEALAAARSLGAAFDTLVVDTEQGQVRLGLARRVCHAAGGHYVRLDQPLDAAVRLLQKGSHG